MQMLYEISKKLYLQQIVLNEIKMKIHFVYAKKIYIK